MRAQLLVIDGTPRAGSLIQLLERDGYACHQARGPIRVRSLLHDENVDLIVWREEPGNPDLTRDLLRECSDHPDIPIIHLFEHAIPHPAVAGHPQIRESLPADAASSRILSLLNRIFDSPRVEPVGSAPPRTELAFRHLVSTLWARRGSGGTEGIADGNEIRAPVTSINLAERESLSSEYRRVPPESAWWRFFQALTSRFRAFLALNR
jgi:hypothetical protein